MLFTHLRAGLYRQQADDILAILCQQIDKKVFFGTLNC